MIETEHNNKAIGFVSTSFQVVLNRKNSRTNKNKGFVSTSFQVVLNHIK